MTLSPALLAFFEETETHMDELETALLALEKDNANAGYVGELFRIVHSIKGNAGLVGLKEIHTISTVMETMLDKLRKEKTPVSQKDLDRLFEFLDNMHSLMEKAAHESGMEIRGSGQQENAKMADGKQTGKESPASEKKTGPADKGVSLEAEGTVEKDASTPQEKKMEAFLTFQLGKERYGVDINKVMEIILNKNLTRVPHAKGFVSGIMNLRGMVIPVINARKKLKFASGNAAGGNGTASVHVSGKSSEWENIIIIENDGLRTGILVDFVDDIVRFKDDMIVSAEQALGGINTDFIQGVGKTEDKTILLLDIKTFCDSKEEYF
ncbi:MAG: chemotaxis protein CheW [Nitrospinota bacterium]|nr:chemotaxis protein CheW [Nitrospinota bacterium]